MQTGPVWTVVLLVAGLVLLIVGAGVLVRGSAALARRLGLTPLVIGLTVVAFGTSAPELLVSVSGAVAGHGDLAVGNVVGSNIFNIGVVLGLAALLSPIRVELGLLRLDAPLLVGVSLLAGALASLPTIPRWCGAGLVVLLIGYTGLSVRLARQSVDPGINREFENGVPNRMRSSWIELLSVVLGLTLLVAGSDLLVDSSVDLARAFGVGEGVIGLTIVSAGTSLPELATSVVATLRRQSDIAVGNVIGSNIFNVLGILGTAALARPLDAPQIDAVDLSVMVVFAVVLVPLLWTGRTLKRWEGATLLIGYSGYVWWLWPS